MDQREASMISVNQHKRGARHAMWIGPQASRDPTDQCGFSGSDEPLQGQHFSAAQCCTDDAPKPDGLTRRR